jgi:type VI secretion system protein ImpL
MASWQADQLKYALGLGGLFSFYGIVMMIVWIVGDRLQAPYNHYTYRIVIIGVILLTLPLTLIIGFVSSRRKRKAEEAQKLESENQAAQKTDAGKPQKSAPAPGNDEIAKGAEEVAQFLKSSNLDVYALPWYLVMGNYKSGKTSLVLGSNLNFQNLPSQRQSEQKFIRPTRGIEWRVTSDAVFIDTAGRYQSENETDAEEFASLLETIKKYRAQRPLDGMIVSASAERILHADEKEIEEQAKVLRARIDDAVQRTKIRFPIYLVFTHADAIEGFRDSFSTSQKENENLVWGATIPLEKSDNGHALFDQEFDLLQNSVMKRRLIRLSAPFAPIRQLRIFNFPLHFGSARRKLGAFVSTLFRPNPFSESPFLRGFYFTAVPVNRPKMPQGGQTLAGVPQTVGETYFTTKLFRDVILRDKDLVATLQAQRQKPPILGWVLTAVGAFLVTLLLGLSAYSLYQNKVLLDRATAAGEKVLTLYKSDSGRDPLTKNAGETQDELLTIDSLRKNLEELDKYEREGAPWLMRMGLYSGDRIYKERLLKIYFNAIEARFKQPVVRKIEEDLKKFAAASGTANAGALTPQDEEMLGKNYDLLKAYLMLSSQPEYRKHAEGAFLTTTLADYWKSESKVGAPLELVAQQQLDFWAKQVDRDEFPFILNDKIIADVRKKLQAFPAWQRYYKRKTTDISKTVNQQEGDLTVANILTKRGAASSYVEGSYRVPNVFSLEGLRLMDEAVKNSGPELTADDWVMGEGARSQAQGTEASLIQERYYRDYADEWRKFVKGINVRKYENATDADRALEEFTSANSPMKILMQEIARQTNLSAEPKNLGWTDWFFSLFSGSKKVETGGKTPVEEAFRPLFAFVEGDSFSKYDNALQKVHNQIHNRSANEIENIIKEIAAERGETLKALRDADKDISGITGTFNATPAGQELAVVFNKPIGNLRDLLGAGATSQLNRAWAEQILPKAKEIEKGYPFEDAGESDITKLSVFLNPTDGTLSDFYEKRLKQYFEESGGQLKVKSTSDVKFSDEFVAYLNNAFRLREAMFGKNKTPSFNYEFKLQKVEGALIEITIDGQTVDSNGTGTKNLRFPATSGETGVIMKFASTAGTSSTSGATTPSANTSPANVSNASNSNTVSRFFQNTTGSPSEPEPLKFPGTWGLFKFVEAGAPKKNTTTGEYVLTYKLGGKTISATVKPTGGDLFDRNVFKSVRAPQNFLKQ